MDLPINTASKFEDEARAFAFAVISQVSKSSEDDVDVVKSYELFEEAMGYYFDKRCAEYPQD